MASTLTDSGGSRSTGVYWLIGIAYAAVIGSVGWALIEPLGPIVSSVTVAAGLLAPLVARRYV